MMVDEAMVMAFVDGELDAITAARVQRAAAADPKLASDIAAHRALRMRLATAFSDIAEAPVPDRLTAMLSDTVIPFRRRSRPQFAWAAIAGIAACLLAVVVIERPAPDAATADVAGRAGTRTIGEALDTQLASATGDTRVLVSFRNGAGAVCRVFAAPSLDGIACRDGAHWSLVREHPAMGGVATSAYRQAGSPNAGLLATAQTMMVGEPFDEATERQERRNGWR